MQFMLIEINRENNITKTIFDRMGLQNHLKDEYYTTGQCPGYIVLSANEQFPFYKGHVDLLSECLMERNKKS
jgi:hypothetical protein